MRIALDHACSVPARKTALGRGALDRSARRAVPFSHGTRPSRRARGGRSPPRRSGSPTASRSSTAQRAGYPAPAPAADRRRPTSACRSRRPPSAPATSTCRPGSSRPAAAQPGPGVALVHGWESARDRTLPKAVFLHAAGFHCLTIDVRGHGANPPETLPDQRRRVRAGRAGRLRGAARPAGGHDRGDLGPLDGRDRGDPRRPPPIPRVAAVVATSRPADPYRLTRQTFRLARLPIPDADRLSRWPG